MAAGLPILFAGGGEGAELVKMHNTGWVCSPGDFGAMKQAITEISQLDNDQFRAIRLNCLNAARGVFDRNVQVTCLSQFLQAGVDG
jgi:hypothetical protein